MLSTVLLVACAACIIVAQLFILRIALGTPVVAHEDARLRRPRLGADVAWAVLPAIALTLVLSMTWRESRAAISSAPAAPAHGGLGAHES